MTTTLLIIGGGLGLLLIMGAGAALLLGGDGGSVNVDERLEDFTGVNPEWVELAEEHQASQPEFADRLDKAIQGRGFSFFDRIKGRLSKADLKLKVVEYIGLVFIFAAVGAGIAILLLGDLWWGALGAFVGIQVPRIYVSRAAKMRIRAFEEQLSDTLNLWVNALRAGFSVLQGMEAIATELPPPVSVEFERVLQEIRLGIPMEESMENMLRRVPSEDLDLVVTAVNIQREVGGNLTEILEGISFTIRERVRIKGEIRTLTAQGRATGWVITLLPVGLTLALFTINRSYIMQLFDNQEPFIIPGLLSCGMAMVILSVIMIISGGFAIQKIVDIEV